MRSAKADYKSRLLGSTTTALHPPGRTAAGTRYELRQELSKPRRSAHLTSYLLTGVSNPRMNQSIRPKARLRGRRVRPQIPPAHGRCGSDQPASGLNSERYTTEFSGEFAGRARLCPAEAPNAVVWSPSGRRGSSHGQLTLLGETFYICEHKGAYGRDYARHFPNRFNRASENDAMSRARTSSNKSFSPVTIQHAATSGTARNPWLSCSTGAAGSRRTPTNARMLSPSAAGSMCAHSREWRLRARAA